jgi:hypothetical protein
MEITRTFLRCKTLFLNYTVKSAYAHFRICSEKGFLGRPSPLSSGGAAKDSYCGEEGSGVDFECARLAADVKRLAEVPRRSTSAPIPIVFIEDRPLFDRLRRLFVLALEVDPGSAVL